MAHQHLSRGIRTKGSAEWFWLNNTLVDDYGPILGAHGIAVYTVLARFVAHPDQSCYPSYRTIAKRLRLSRRKVIAIIGQLEACGLVRREPRMDGAGDAQSNQYTLLSLDPVISDEVVHAVHQGSGSGAPGVVHTVHPNKTYREQDLDKEDSVLSSTDDTPEPGRDADLTLALPRSGLRQLSEAMRATSPRSSHADRQDDSLNFDADSRQDQAAVDHGGNPKKRKHRTTQATRASSSPESFPITEAMCAWAQEHLPGVNVDRETDQLLDYHRAKGSVFKDWTAAWRTWMRNAPSFQKPRATSRASASQADMNSTRQEAVVL
jgi:Helix-turn-helix domain